MTNNISAPVAIGGIGGSGTRVIALILKELGYYIGGDLNQANDNLWFTLLFKRKEILSVSDNDFQDLIDIFVNAMTRRMIFKPNQIELINSLAELDREQHPSVWLKERANSLSAITAVVQTDAWAWKEPNTHIVIDRLLKYIPNMKYIHVMRNGLDMAYSGNQNQLMLWGKHFLGADYEITPYYSLKYWHIVHECLLDVCSLMGNRFYLLNYDKFCLETKNSMLQLSDFLEINLTEAQIKNCCNLVNNPSSIGRFKEHGIEGFDPIDTAFVNKMGFELG